ncbi:ABC transporter permease [Geobacillus sp. YHL]|uniref:ABC transporter permease n=1 Tax=Geobacillus sp. YHL TaxID=2796117 RepID=UPI001EF0863C|nr:ABC transporter permease [Geobacillus sp. YHL]
MNDVIWLVRYTLKRTFRRKINFLLYFGTPLAAILLSLFAYGSSPAKDVRIGVVNEDHGRVADDAIRFLKQIDHLSVKSVKLSAVDDQITSQKVDGVLIFPQGFSESVQHGQPRPIQLVSLKGAEITMFIKSYLHEYIDHLATLGRLANGDRDLFWKMYERYQQAPFRLSVHSLSDTAKQKGVTYQTIGYLVMIMLMSAGNLTEIIIKEKEERTYSRLLTTPIQARTYVLSNIVVNLLMMAAQIIVTIVAMKNIFHIDPNISMWQMALVLLLFSLSAIGLSLITVMFANSSASAGALQPLVTVPTCMLAGCFWPVELMPEFLQKAAYFIPQRWALDCLVKLQEGRSFGSLYWHLLILLAFALTFFLLAVYKFSRSQQSGQFI